MKRYKLYLPISLLWLLSAVISFHRQHTTFATVAVAIAALNLAVFARERRRRQ